MSHLRENDRAVDVGVISCGASLFFGGDDCLDPLEIRLGEPLGDRELIDLHTHQRVRVIEVDPST